MSEAAPTFAVCVKFVPDTAQLRADSQTRAPRLDEAPLRISTFDEHALEEAVRLKEAHGGRVEVLSLVAAPPPEELVLKLLAMGADRVCLVEEPTAHAADALATARVLGAALQKLGTWELVLCGEGSIDSYARQVGPRIAAELDIPVLTHVTQLDREAGSFTAHRGLEDRTEVVACAAPLVVAVGQEINQPRFPTVLQILGASQKPTEFWNLADLGLPDDTSLEDWSGVTTTDVRAPEAQRSGLVISGDSTAEVAEQLARELFARGLVKLA
jgi:electron transfer flavoprotein beta subunit